MKKIKLVKFGIDPTANDLHLGHLVPLIKAREFQEDGNLVHIIIGDFTARIGDPSGRDKTRPQLSTKDINNNIDTIIEQIKKILINDERLLISFNSEWLKHLTLPTLLKLTSSLTIAQILERRDFKERFESNKPLSLTELMYPLLQGYDSVHIEADVEIGGTDQLFNLQMGRHLQRHLGLKEQEIITLPILRGIDGVQKMSKSLGNSINLSDSAEEMFFKVMRIPDELIEEYKDLLVPNLQLIDNDPRQSKADLALAIVTLLHDIDSAVMAENKFISLVTNKEFQTDINEEQGQLLSKVAIKYLPSRNEFKRLLSQNAIRIDGEVIKTNIVLSSGQLEIGKKIKINII